MKIILLKAMMCCVFVISGPVFALAQDTHLPLVTVTGKGEVKITPDEVEVRFGVERTSTSVEKAKRGIDSVIDMVNKIIRSSKISPSQVTMDYVQIQNMFPGEFQNSPRQYFKAMQGMSVVLKDISMYENFVSELMKAGINRIDYVDFRSSLIRKHQDAARDLAVKAAREKAEALAKSLGQSIGGAYSIEEFPEHNYPVMRMANQSMDGAAAPDSFGQIAITANVTVRFYLK